MSRKLNSIIKKVKSSTKLSGRNPDLEEELKKAGQETVDNAAHSKKTGNITFNQMDAFAWGLWFNGELIDHGFAGGKKATEPTRKGEYGRDMARDVIESYSPESEGYVLMVTNAVWYSGIHEERGLPILSQETGLLEALEAKYNGKLTLINTYTGESF